MSKISLEKKIKNLFLQNEDTSIYRPEQDVIAVRKLYPVTSPLFSIALIKLRYEKMSRANQIRAEKTLRFWDKKNLDDGTRFWE
mgnify:CR=1 FL=1|tara:strand:+ start:2011 stop:2262 length:252 start_codon:yes stop_codon:yes gene_type:complete